MKLYSSLTRQVEEFTPRNPPDVTMYTCGPTVYGPGHLGHFRTYIAFDLLKRVLQKNGFSVNHVLNITDVHDDMIAEADRRGVTIFDLANEYVPQFLNDLNELNVLPATSYPRVTEVIPEIIAMTQVLVDKGFAYVAPDGSVYFDVSKFGEYGKLSGIRVEESVTGTRVATDKYEREEAQDFALWKSQKEGEIAWDSPWGKGRPGWHIECSVMARKLLGDTLDIHGGAMDLKFPHHENEIAQSEAANGVPLAIFWAHAGLLDIEGQKMSKSLGNIFTLDDLKDRGFTPSSFRYLTLTAHYRSRLNFTWEGLEAAQTALKRLRRSVREWEESKIGCAQYEENFSEAVGNDLDMPRALSFVWDLVKSDYPSSAKHASILKFDEILGLKLLPKEATVASLALPQEVADLVAKRDEFRRQNDFQKADEIRREIEEKGFIVEDTPQGPKVRPLSV